MAAMVASLDFWSELLLLLLSYKLPRYFLPSFRSIGLSVQENFKIDFQDGNHGGHLGFPIGMILAIFDLPVTSILPTKFQVSWLLVQEKMSKIDFWDGSHGSHLAFPIGMILDIFIYKPHWYLLPSFESTGLSVRELKIDFQDGSNRSKQF